jgi:hypothetical protein
MYVTYVGVDRHSNIHATIIDWFSDQCTDANLVKRIKNNRHLLQSVPAHVYMLWLAKIPAVALRVVETFLHFLLTYQGSVLAVSAKFQQLTAAFQ